MHTHTKYTVEQMRSKRKSTYAGQFQFWVAWPIHARIHTYIHKYTCTCIACLKQTLAPPPKKKKIAFVHVSFCLDTRLPYLNLLHQALVQTQVSAAMYKCKARFRLRACNLDATHTHG
jgi:hypothetical protein